MFANMGSPPIVDYEQIVRPVAVTTRDAALDEKDRRQELRQKRKEKKKSRLREEADDPLFEPFLGKLFDYSA